MKTNNYCNRIQFDRWIRKFWPPPSDVNAFVNASRCTQSCFCLVYSAFDRLFSALAAENSRKKLFSLKNANWSANLRIIEKAPLLSADSSKLDCLWTERTVFWIQAWFFAANRKRVSKENNIACDDRSENKPKCRRKMMTRSEVKFEQQANNRPAPISSYLLPPWPMRRRLLAFDFVFKKTFSSLLGKDLFAIASGKRDSTLLCDELTSR